MAKASQTDALLLDVPWDFMDIVIVMHLRGCFLIVGHVSWEKKERKKDSVGAGYQQR